MKEMLQTCLLSISIFQRERRRLAHAQKETEFLRLKRTRLGLSDFEMLKIIGRGAFGEVGKFEIIYLINKFI